MKNPFRKGRFFSSDKLTSEEDDLEEDFDEKESQLDVEPIPFDVEDGEMNFGPPNEEQPPIIFRGSVANRFKAWVHDLYELTDEPGNVSHQVTSLDPARPQHEYSMPTFVADEEKNADHFQNLDSVKNLIELENKDKDFPEPTHKDILPHLENVENSNVRATFSHWFEFARDLGLIDPKEDSEGNNWYKNTTKTISVSKDQLIASQIYTAGKSRTSGLPIVFPYGGGKFVILNGHHRIVNEIINGQTQFNVNVLMTFDELKKVKPPQSPSIRQASMMEVPPAMLKKLVNLSREVSRNIQNGEIEDYEGVIELDTSGWKYKDKILNPLDLNVSISLNNNQNDYNFVENKLKLLPSASKDSIEHELTHFSQALLSDEVMGGLPPKRVRDGDPYYEELYEIRRKDPKSKKKPPQWKHSISDSEFWPMIRKWMAENKKDIHSFEDFQRKVKFSHFFEDLKTHSPKKWQVAYKYVYNELSPTFLKKEEPEESWLDDDYLDDDEYPESIMDDELEGRNT